MPGLRALGCATGNPGGEDFERGVPGKMPDSGDDAGGGNRGFRQHKDRRTRAAESDSEHLRLSGQGKKLSEKRTGFHAVGLVDAILHGVAEEIAASEGEGGDKEGCALDVGDSIDAAVGGGQKATGFLRGEGCGGQRDMETPVEVFSTGCCNYAV